MSIFGDRYSRSYDAIYESKNYESEVNRIVALAQANGLQAGARVLDFGCGTGRHGVEMAKLGFQMTLTDRSDHMLEIARQRCDPGIEIASLHSMSNRHGEFDLVYSIFDVLSYQTKPQEAVYFVRELASLCKVGGLVVFDAWHLPGLHVDKPADRRGTFTDPHSGQQWERFSQVSVDWLHGVTTINYSLTTGARGHEVVETEKHVMRAFTVLELELLAGLAGLNVLALLCAPDLTRHIEEGDWHVAALCRRMDEVKPCVSASFSR